GPTKTGPTKAGPTNGAPADTPTTDGTPKTPSRKKPKTRRWAPARSAAVRPDGTPPRSTPPHSRGTVADRFPEEYPMTEQHTSPAATTDNVEEVDSFDADVSRETSTPSAADRLEREGDAAADYLEKLLDVADLDGDIDVDIDGDRAAVAIVDSEQARVPCRLVGRYGEVLEALQELTRLAVLAQTGE